MDMYHHSEVVEAICGICQGAVRLCADAEGTAVLQVGSNRLFSTGDTVSVSDETSGPEMRTVVCTRGLTEVHLDRPLDGSYLVEHRARVQIQRADLPRVAWVGRGRPELAPPPATVAFPCVVVEPLRLEQPPAAGSNRTFTQEYITSVYYIRRQSAGEEAEMRLLDETAGLFNLLMADPYLGGTCWYSQVTRVEYDPAAEKALRDTGAAVRMVRLEVLARRSELGPGAQG